MACEKENGVCECSAEDTRGGRVGSGDNICVATVTIKSFCEQIEVGKSEEDIENIPESLIEASVPDVLLCRVTYEITVAKKTNTSVVEFIVDGESFEFAKPIEPGKSDIVSIVAQKPAECEKKKAGSVKFKCEKEDKIIILDKIEVCVLN